MSLAGELISHGGAVLLVNIFGMLMVLSVCTKCTVHFVLQQGHCEALLTMQASRLWRLQVMCAGGRRLTTP